MAITVNVQDAKTRLSELLALVEKGEEVLIARAGTPVARLDPVHRVPDREFGVIELALPETFFESRPEEELASWE